MEDVAGYAVREIARNTRKSDIIKTEKSIRTARPSNKELSEYKKGLFDGKNKSTKLQSRQELI